jgi:hypothetical protein
VFPNLLDCAIPSVFVRRSSANFCYLPWTRLKSVVRMSSARQCNSRGILVLNSCYVYSLQPSNFDRTLMLLQSREFDRNQLLVVVGEEVTPKLPIYTANQNWRTLICGNRLVRQSIEPTILADNIYLSISALISISISSSLSSFLASAEWEN